MDNRSQLNRLELPIQNSKRKNTDVCCTIVNAIFILTLFIIACVHYSKNGVTKVYFQDGSQNFKSCGQQLSYYSDVNNPNSKSCLDLCPNGYYDRYRICWPQSSTLQTTLLSNPYIASQYNNNGLSDTLFWIAVTAVALGILILVLVQFTPRLAPLIVVIMAVVFLIALLVITFVSNIFSNGSNWVAIFIIFLLIVIISVMGFIYRNALRLQGIFLDYTRRFLYECPYTYLYIPLYLLFRIGLFSLFIFQHLAFSSVQSKDHNFFDYSNPGFLGFLNLIELIWGIQFLKDSFHYCISGVATDWYWKRQISTCSPLYRLVTRNWGSVIAGSFLNGFFQIPTLIAQLLTCHKRACCSRAGQFCQKSCSCLGFIFYLVRTDAYTYINLTGSAYCDSARECTNVCYNNTQFIGNYNILKHYRFVAHVALINLLVIIGYFYAKLRVFELNFWTFFNIIIISQAIITWFIDIYADGAEAISTNFFIQSYLSQSYQFMQHAIPSYRNEIQFRGSKYIQDGNL